MIPFLDIKHINARFKNEFDKEFSQFLDSGRFVLGTKLTQFEKEYAAYCGTKFCLGVGNGLEAIQLIFKGYIHLGKLNVGDEVLVPANTYIASILAIINAGLKPIFVDAGNHSYNISLEDLKRKISSKTKAILIVHLYGELVAIDAINKIVENESILVVEDAAQAHGANHLNGKKAGALANAAAFSFYPSKNLGALGDGGAITTDDEALYEKLIQLRNYGSIAKYHHEIKGVNSRLDELQAAFLSIKLKQLDQDNEHRKRIAQYYLDHIKNEHIELPINHKLHVYYAFVIRCKSRNRLQEYLTENKIQTIIHYPIPPHKQKALQEYSDVSLPNTELYHNEVLSLPISPIQSIETTQQIINVINQFN